MSLKDLGGGDGQNAPLSTRWLRRGAEALLRVQTRAAGLPQGGGAGGQERTLRVLMKGRAGLISRGCLRLLAPGDEEEQEAQGHLGVRPGQLNRTPEGHRG